MSPMRHAVVSAGAGAAAGLALHSWGAAGACLVTGVMLDLDHFFDYFIDQGPKLDLMEFFDLCERSAFKKCSVLFHAYEWWPLFFLWFSVYGSQPVALGIFTGFALHMAFDQFTNALASPFTYFISYRLYHGFEMRRVFLPSAAGRRRTSSR